MDYLLYNLDRIAPRPEEVYLLDAHERLRYAKRGEKYLLIRSLLKKELARRTGYAAADIHFEYNENGKPFWPHQHFNISHSGNLLCLAFHSSAIGVDIQQVRPVRHMNELAERIMNRQQLERFRAKGAQREEFFTCWCVAEALVKLHGSSIWSARDYPFSYDKGNIIPADSLSGIRIHLFNPAPGFCGAIAMNSDY